MMRTEKLKKQRCLHMYNLGPGSFSELCCRVVGVVDEKSRDYSVDVFQRVTGIKVVCIHVLHDVMNIRAGMPRERQESVYEGWAFVTFEDPRALPMLI
eukprot:5418888-Karenia_brevis.AAC.1